jgi:hypothetical protein
MHRDAENMMFVRRPFAEAPEECSIGVLSESVRMLTLHSAAAATT